MGARDPAAMPTSPLSLLRHSNSFQSEPSSTASPPPQLLLNPIIFLLPPNQWLCVKTLSGVGVRTVVADKYTIAHHLAHFSTLIESLRSISSWAVSHVSASVCVCVCVCVCKMVMANEGGLVHCPGGPSWSATPTQTAGWLMECKCWWIIEQGNDKVGPGSH